MNNKDVLRKKLKQLEKELEHQKKIFHLQNDFNLVFDGDYKITDINQKALSFFETTLHKVKGKTINQLLHPVSTFDFHAMHEKYLAAEKKSLISTVRLKNGFFEIRFSSLTSDSFLLTFKNITELHNKNILLDEEQTHYKSLFDNHKMVMMLIDPDEGRIVNVNKQAEKFYGYTNDQFKSLSIFDINCLPKEKVIEQMKLAQKNKKSYFNFCHKTAKNEIKNVEVYSSPVSIKGKKLLYSIVNDITQHEALKKDKSVHEKRYWQLFKHMNSGIVIFEAIKNGTDFQFKDINDYALNILNFKKQDFDKQTIKSFFKGELKENALELLTYVWDESVPVFLTTLGLSDVPINFETYIYRFSDKEIVCIFDDVTSRKKLEEKIISDRTALKSLNKKIEAKNLQLTRKQAELLYQNKEILQYNKRMEVLYRQLKESEEKFRQLVENIEEVFWIRDLDYERLVYVSPAFKKIWGIIPQEAIKQPGLFLRSIYPEDAHWVNDMYQKSFQKKNLTIEYRIVRKDGEVRWIESKTQIIKTKTTNRQLGIAKDITAQKQYEEDLIRAKEKAEEADQLKSAFLTNMSHEIRTPLNAILGFTEILGRPKLSDDLREKYIKIIKHSSRQLLNMVSDLIDISKIQSKQIELMPEFDNLNAFLKRQQNTYNSIKTEKEKHDIDIRLNLFFPDKKSVISTDFEQLSKIFSYLIENALKFTKKGYIEIGYKLKTSDFIEFFVKDTGIGIKKEKQKIIFDLFRQEDDSDTRKYGGTGLGLSITKGLVQLLGGKIYVKSEKNKGSTFFFSIPYIPPKEIDNNLTANGSKDATSVQLENKKVLVVEDDAFGYEFLKEILIGHQMQTLWARNGEEAVRLCAQHSDIDIVLMDIHLPKLNGYEVTKKIKRLRPGLPVIAQTAHAHLRDRKKNQDAGCSDYISKPLNPKQLLKLMKKYLKE